MQAAGFSSDGRRIAWGNTDRALAIGVDKYPAMGNTCGNGSQSCDLRFAGADARA